MKDSVVIYRSFVEASKMMQPEDFKEYWLALFNYALDEIEPEDIKSTLAEALLIMAIPQIDANIKRRTNGSKGGAPVGNQNAKKQPKTSMVDFENNLKQPNVNVNDNVNVNVNKKENIKEKSIRHKYGEYKNVLLTDEDMEKLKKQFPNDYQQRIENLSSYMKSKGKSYTDHLATIRNWARMDANRDSKAGKKVNSEMMRNDYDFDDLERRLLGDGKSG